MDEFSDDGFDDLNDTVLQELENNAIQLTQAQRPAAAQPPQAQHNAAEYNFDDDDLDDAVVIDQLAQPPPRPPPIDKTLPVQQPRHHSTGFAGTQQRWNQHLPPTRPSYPPRPNYPPPPRPVPQPLSSQRYPPPHSARPQPPPRPSQFSRPTLPGRPFSVQPSQGPRAPGPAQQNEIIAALQSRLSELESDLTAARGEAAILRSKYDKALAAHESEVALLKKQNAEQLAKQERIIEAAREAERTATIELQFARQDLREELGRAKSRRRDGPATPKKTRTWGMADGFDDVETLSSPTRGQGLRRRDSGHAPLSAAERTPTKGKRKRPIVDSPTFALEVDSGDTLDGAQTAAHATQTAASWREARSLPFDFLRVVLDHTTLHSQPLTFDLFSRFAFPSDQGQTFASIIFQKLPQMGDPKEPLRLLADFAELAIDLWQRCLSERYHAPIYYLAALVIYTLELNAVDVAPHVISSLIPVCATTCRLVALPRFNTVDGNLTDHPDAVVRQLSLDIDVTQCLSLLHLAALGCLSPPAGEPEEASNAPKPSPQFQFWRTMELDFVLIMLSPKNPESDWLGMLSLLWTSVSPESLGPVPSSATNQADRNGRVESPEMAAATVIDCVSSFLCESPRWAAPGSVKEIVARSAALKTLVAFATSPFGALQLADSDVAIPRLVTVLCWAIDRLYDVDVALPSRRAGMQRTGNGSRTGGEDAVALDKEASSHAGDVVDVMEDVTYQEQLANDQDGGIVGSIILDEELDRQPRTQELLCRLISQATQLLHFLVTDPRTADVANTATKLAASHGGSQRYLLTLARLTFAEEDLVLEAGIDAETVDLAHELLELAVTPEEGEKVAEMFGD